MTQYSTLTRREFLRGVAGTAVGACLVPVATALADEPRSNPDRIGTLVDLTRCIGCRACVRACNERNGLPQDPHPTTAWEAPQTTQSLTFERWTSVNLAGSERLSEAVPVKHQCLHCLEPACTSVCPVGALHQLDSGAVIWRSERCIGCRYCIVACPFGVPKFQWDAGIAPVIGKCQFCAQGAVFTGPACAAACPTGALKFGRREDLVVEARARVQARPDRYVNHIYGEREAGGTAWLYLADRPFDQLGFVQGVPERALPSLTKWAMQAVPWVATILAVVLSLVAFLPPASTASGPRERA